MRATVPTAVSARPVQTEQLTTWANLESRPVQMQLRDAANFTYRTRVVRDSDGAATYFRVWESDPMPTDGTWIVSYSLVGVTTSGPAQFCAYAEIAAFMSSGGATAPLSPTNTVISAGTEAFSTPLLDVDISARTIFVRTRDDCASPYRFVIVVEINEVVPT